MALHITDVKVGIACAAQTSQDSMPQWSDDEFSDMPRIAFRSLEPIKYKPDKVEREKIDNYERKRVFHNDRVANELENIVTELDVKAFVVSWPLNSSGHMAGECGKVLHLLDQFAERKHPIISCNRPFALLDSRTSFGEPNICENYDFLSEDPRDQTTEMASSALKYFVTTYLDENLKSNGNQMMTASYNQSKFSPSSQLRQI